MLKGIFLYYLLTVFLGNPFLALILLFVLYALIDKAYLGFLPNFSAPIKEIAGLSTC